MQLSKLDDRRPKPQGCVWGKSGLHRAGCWLTASEGNLKERQKKPPKKRSELEVGDKKMIKDKDLEVYKVYRLAVKFISFRWTT